MSPFQVVRSGLLSRHALDEVLQVPPKAYFLQRVVQPTCRGKKHGHETPPSSNPLAGVAQEGIQPVVMQKYVSWGETWWMR